MGTTQEDISRWIKSGKDNGAKFLIVACDTFDYEDYPIYCKDAVECKKEYDNHNGKNMQKIMEVYDLSKDINLQLKKGRSMEVPW